MTVLLLFLLGAVVLGFVTAGDRPRPMWTVVLVTVAFVVGASFLRLGTI